MSYLPKIQSRYPKEIIRDNKGRRNFRIPFGYRQHEKDKQLFIANWEKLYALEKALEYVEEGATFRAAAKWLRATTEEYVSHVFLYYERNKRQLKYERARKGITTSKRDRSLEKNRELLNVAKRRASSSSGQE